MAEKPPETIHCCEICGQEGLRDEEMRTHMLLIHIEGATSCPFCDLSDISVDEMIVHVNSVHLDYLTPDEEYKPVCTDYKPQITIDGACASPSRYNANYNHNFNANSLLDSPQRSQLSLNLKSWKNPCSASINDGGRQGQRARIQTPTPNDGITTHCPICGHCERSPTKLQEHVNRQHFDLTSPSFPDISPLDGESYFNCPLCMRHFESSPDLELHVNMEHKDILSPAQSAQVTPADENCNESCPVCSQNGFKSALEMAHHIEEHFEKRSQLPLLEGASSSECLLGIY